ncbi:MAG: hypothetical protein ACKO0U_07425 [Gammaproteobacteria bacterium]
MRSEPALLPSRLALLVMLFATPVWAGTLDTPAQLARERALIGILKQPEMRAATARAEQVFRNDPQARSAAGGARLRVAAAALAAAATHYALGSDPSRTEVNWSVNAPHRWHGLSVPGSGFGIDNPDNVYQGFSVQGGGRYVLHGRLPVQGPVQVHLEVRDTIPGMGDMTIEASRQLATLQSEQWQVDADGHVRILIDSEPAAGRANHLAIPAAGVLDIGIRQLFTAWGQQAPVAFHLERLDARPSPTPRDLPRLASRAAAILDRQAPFWLGFYDKFIYALPVNSIPVPRARPGGRGLSVMAHFELAADEVLMVTLDDLGAASLGIQAADRWGLSYEYRHRTSSLNNAQAQRDVAGTYTFLVAPRDPGYHNWIDTSGFGLGTLVLRWQALPGTRNPADAIRTVKVLKRAELAGQLPAGQSRLSSAERRRQRAERERDYRSRLLR